MGSSGVQRPLKFVKYLHQFGWQPVVLAPHPGVYHTFDESLNEELTKTETPIYRVDAKTPFHLAGKSSRQIKYIPNRLKEAARTISSFFYIPDNKTGWIKPAISKADEILSDYKIDAVFSTSPPPSNHLIAAELSKKHGLPAVMDFRDDWLEYPLSIYPTRLHRRKNAKLEYQTVRSADGVVANNRSTLDSLKSRIFPDDEIPSRVITHGFDPDDFPSNTEDSAEKNDKIKFLYSGIFYEQRKPDRFLEAVQNLIKKGFLREDEFEIHFQGGLDDSVIAKITSMGMKKNLVDYGYVEHRQAVQNLFKADVLWFIIKHSKQSDTVTPGKLYEYMATRKPILGLIPDGDAKNTLKEYNAGFSCNPDDAEKIESTLQSIIEKWRNGSLPDPDEKVINRYNRQTLTGELAGFLDEVAGLEKVKSYK